LADPASHRATDFQSVPLTRAALAGGLAALFLAQLYLTLAAFASPEDLFSSRPILNVDWCSQYYWAFAARSLFQASGRIWGFDPFYMAGYPLDFIFNSALPVQLSAIALPSLPLGTVIKLFYLATSFALPILLYFSLKNFELNPLPALAGAALGTSYYWLAEPGLFAQWGMLSGAFLLYFFLYPLSLWHRWLQRREARTLIILFLALPLAFLIHKTAFVLLPIPMLLLLIPQLRRLRGADYLRLAGLGLAVLLANYWWWLPFFHLLPFKIEDPTTTFFQNTDPLRFLKDLSPLQPFFGLALGRDLIFGFALAGLVREKSLRPWLAPLAFFFLFTYFGSFLPLLRHLQPYRYVSAFYFLLLPAAAGGLRNLRSSFPLQLPSKKMLDFAFLLTLVILHFLPNFRLFYYVAPLRSTFEPEVAALHHWLAENTDRSARILIEDNNLWQGKQRTYGGARYPGILPALLPRECIGGPLPNAFIRHHLVDFSDGRFLGRPIQEIPDDLLKQRLDLYNVKWVVTWSEPSRQRFQRLAPWAALLARFNGLCVFGLEREPDFFFRGRGRLQADFDRITLSGLQPEEGKVVIKYHYLEGFRSEPPVKTFPVPVADDPVGFLGLEAPPENVVLSFKP